MHGRICFYTTFTLSWSIQLKCLQLSLSSSCIRSRASNAVWLYQTSWLHFTLHRLIYNTLPTLPYSTILWHGSTKLFYSTVSDSTVLYYTLLSPPVLWLSLLYPTLLYAYWSYSLHYQTLFDCSVHYHGFVPAWFYCTTLLYTTLTIADLTILNGSISGVYLAIESVFYMLVLPYSTISYQIKALPTVCRLYTMVKKWRVIEAW